MLFDSCLFCNVGLIILLLRGVESEVK